jgi:hypothetical protein
MRALGVAGMLPLTDQELETTWAQPEYRRSIGDMHGFWISLVQTSVNNRPRRRTAAHGPNPPALYQLV